MPRHAVTPIRNTADRPPTPDLLRVVRTAEPSPAHNRDTTMTNCPDCDRLRAELAELRNTINGLAAGLIVAASPTTSDP